MILKDSPYRQSSHTDAAEKEILQAQLDLEEKIGRDLKAALRKALNKTVRKVKELQLSEIMEKLPEAAVFSIPDTSGEPIDLPQQRGQVYQAQYQQEITEYVQEPITLFYMHSTILPSNDMRKHYRSDLNKLVEKMNRHKIDYFSSSDAVMNAFSIIEKIVDEWY